MARKRKTGTPAQKSGKASVPSIEKQNRNRKIRTRKPKTQTVRVRHTRKTSYIAPLIRVICGLLMVAAVIVGSMVFFKVDSITVEGGTHYTAEEVVAASGVETGANLFLLNRRDIESRLEEKLPFIGTAVLHRSLPGTVRITVEDCEATVALAVSNGYWNMDANGKLLELTESSNGLPVVSGLSLLAPNSGRVLTVDAAYKLKKSTLINLMGALEQEGLLDNVGDIDLSDGSCLYMEYMDRYRVKIPYVTDLDYKVRALEGIVNALAEQQDSSYGTIDLTMDNEWHYIPD